MKRRIYLHLCLFWMYLRLPMIFSRPEDWLINSIAVVITLTVLIVAHQPISPAGILGGVLAVQVYRMFGRYRRSKELK